MSLPICPVCGSDDITRDDAAPHGSDSIGLRCLGCGQRWSRHPKVVCRRCGSEDIEYGVFETWTHDGSEPEDPNGGAAWGPIAHETFRCRRCNQRWITGRSLPAPDDAMPR